MGCVDTFCFGYIYNVRLPSTLGVGAMILPAFLRFARNAMVELHGGVGATAMLRSENGAPAAMLMPLQLTSACALVVVPVACRRAAACLRP